MKNYVLSFRYFIHVFIICMALAITAQAQDFTPYLNECKIEKQGTKYGLAFRGIPLIKYEYDIITAENARTYKVKQNNKYGIFSLSFINEKSYKNSRNPNGGIPVHVSGRTHYLCAYPTLPCVYDSVTPYSSNRWLLIKDGKRGLSDQYFNTVIPCKFDLIEENKGTYFVTEANKHGVFDQYGNTVILCKFDKVRWDGGKYYVTNGDLKGIFDRYGNTTIPCKYTQIEESDNRYNVLEGKYYGIIDRYGNTVIPAKYTGIQKRNNHYWVCRESKHGVFDQYGNTVIPCSYDTINRKDNIYRVYNTGKTGLSDNYGNTILPCSYDNIEIISNKYIVKRSGLYGVHDKYGNTLLPCKFQKIEMLSNGHYRTSESKTVKLFDAYGNLLPDVSEQRILYSTSPAE